MFKWGYAKTIPTKLIEYGDPDNTGKDLQGYNQVYLRAEAYIGWGIMDVKFCNCRRCNNIGVTKMKYRNKKTGGYHR